MTVPPQALVSIAAITLRNVSSSSVDPLPDGLEPTSDVFAFEPHGQNFAVPVDIALACRGRDDAIYTSVDGTRWEVVSGIVREGAFSHVYQDHFSYFACADDPGVEVCNVPGDEDDDGSSDCEDDDCEGVPECRNPDIEDCSTAADDDGDGQVNCRDPDCLSAPICADDEGEGGAGGAFESPPSGGTAGSAAAGADSGGVSGGSAGVAGSASISRVVATARVSRSTSRSSRWLDFRARRVRRSWLL